MDNLDDVDFTALEAENKPKTICLFFASVKAKNYFLELLSFQGDVKVDLGMNDTVPLFEVEEVSVNVYGEDGEYVR